MQASQYWVTVPVCCDILPCELPTTPGNVCDCTLLLKLLEIYNWTGTDVTVSVYDRQPVPIPLLFNETVVKMGILTYKADAGRRMQGGITWVCSVPGVFGYVNGYNMKELA